MFFEEELELDELEFWLEELEEEEELELFEELEVEPEFEEFPLLDEEFDEDVAEPETGSAFPVSAESIEATFVVVSLPTVFARRFFFAIALIKTQIRHRIITPMTTETKMIFFFETVG